MSKYTFALSNAIGSVYRGGNVVFAASPGSTTATSSGRSDTPGAAPGSDSLLISPVGNRIQVIDLVHHASHTLDVEARSDIARIAVSPDSRLLLAVDVDGFAVAVNLSRRIVIHRFNFKARPEAITFSPDGSYFAVALGNKVQVWRTPGLEREFAAFVLHRTYTGHYGPVTCVSWSPNGQYLVTGSRDATCRIYSLHPIPGFIPVTLTGHRDEVVSAFFAEEDVIYSVAADAGVFIWAWKERPQVSEAAAEALAAKARRLTERAGGGGAGGDDEHVGDSDEDDDDDDDDEEDEGRDGTGAGGKSSSGAGAGAGRQRRGAGAGAGADDVDATAGVGSKRTRGPGRHLGLGTDGYANFAEEDAAERGGGVAARRAVGLSRSGTVAALTEREGGRGRSVRSATDMLASRRPHAVPAPFAGATREAAALAPSAARSARTAAAAAAAEAGLDVDSASDGADGDDADAGAGAGASGGSGAGITVAERTAARQAVLLTVAHGEWTLSAKHLIRTARAKVHSAALHAGSGLLVLGLTSGVFSLHTMPDGAQVHSLSISSHTIHASAINGSGDWLAFGSATLGQLLVWEWKTETYVLKQQGHFYDMSAVAYSPNGQLVATGGDDGKVKVWNVATGFCFVTFAEHTAPVTGVAFMGGRGTGHGLAVVSASLDGTVRAFDLVRYRNFRTFTPPAPVQFSALAVDEGGEVVMAAGMDPFTIHVWSVQTGKLLDVLAGHEGPISSLSYSPAAGLLASASWDKTVRLWDVFRSGTATETLRHGSDALAVAFRPDGVQLAASTLDGGIHFWDVRRGVEVASIDGRRDAAGGRKPGDARTAASSAAGKCFTALAYTADGECVLAGGRTKFACLYAVAPRLLLRKWQLTHNRGIAGVLDKLSGRDLGEAGHKALLDLDTGGAGAGGGGLERDATSAAARTVGGDASLPGVRRGDAASARAAPREIRTRALAFSPTGRAFALATSACGLLLYGLDESLSFDPFELGEDVTPDAAAAALADGQFVRALLLALHLNEAPTLAAVLEGLPAAGLPLIMSVVPTPFLARLVDWLAARLHPGSADRSPHAEFYLRALLALLTAHSRTFRERPSVFAACLRGAQRALLAQRDLLARMLDGNGFALDFLAHGFGFGDESEAAAASASAATAGAGAGAGARAGAGAGAAAKAGSAKHASSSAKQSASAAAAVTGGDDGDDDDDAGDWVGPGAGSSAASTAASSGKAKPSAESKAKSTGKGKGKGKDSSSKDTAPAVEELDETADARVRSLVSHEADDSEGVAAAAAAATSQPSAKRRRRASSAASGDDTGAAAASSAGAARTGADDEDVGEVFVPEAAPKSAKGKGKAAGPSGAAASGSGSGSGAGAASKSAAKKAAAAARMAADDDDDGDADVAGIAASAPAKSAAKGKAGSAAVAPRSAVKFALPDTSDAGAAADGRDSASSAARSAPASARKAGSAAAPPSTGKKNKGGAGTK